MLSPWLSLHLRKSQLIYEKKKKADVGFPTEKLSRGSVKTGEAIEISLDTGETYNLFEGLRKLYELKNGLGTIPLGSSTFTRVDDSFRQFQKIISSVPSAKNWLRELNEANISSLYEATSITKLERILNLLDKNINNSHEEEWQTIIKENQWILSQVFSCPYTIFEKKAYIGGKGIDNRNGNVCDFIYQNSLTQNIALIEIKTPCTDLLGSKYRGTYSLSNDMSGAVNQILNYKEHLTKEFYTIRHKSNSPFEVLNPMCCVIIGRIDKLKSDQIKTFENYRNSLSNVIVITFDELRTRVSDMLQLFSTDGLL